MPTHYEDTLGYDPYAGSVPAITQEDWLTDFAITFANHWANGTIHETQLHMGGGLMNDFLAQFGLGPLNPADRGSGEASPQTVQWFYQLGEHFMSNWDSLPPEMRGGMADPTRLSPMEPTLSPDDKAAIARAEDRARDRAHDAEQAAADRAHREDIVRMQEEGQDRRLDRRLATDRDIADLRADVDREAIASRERIAAGDRESREGIAGMEEEGRNRRFDLGLAEERRQFNTGILMGLLDRGVELSRRPVDWIAHQFFLQNMNIPATAVALGSSASVFGAVPPSGPSGAGPVSGGPAAMDGDFQLAQAVGDPDPGFVDMAQAIQENPGGATTGQDAQRYMAASTIEGMGGLQAVEGMVQQARQMELSEALPHSPATQQYMQTHPQPAPTPLADPGGVDPMAPREPMPEPMRDMQPMEQQMAMAPPPGAQVDMSPPQQVQVPHSEPRTGVFTGEPAQPPQGAFGQPMGGTGAQSPQGVNLLQELANQTGIPLETLQQLVPPHLLAGGYSPDVIAQSPVIQSLVNNERMGAFRTAPAEGTQFGEIQAFGIPLGLRGGQDMSASNFLRALPSQQEQMQGAIEATGQHFPDFLSQMLRSSPTTNFEAGAFGRRRF